MRVRSKIYQNIPRYALIVHVYVYQMNCAGGSLGLTSALAVDSFDVGWRGYGNWRSCI